MNEDSFESELDIYISLQKIRRKRDVVIRDTKNTPTKLTKATIPPSMVRFFKSI
jgi:hypothetical protein